MHKITKFGEKIRKLQHGHLTDVKILEIMLKKCSSKCLEKRREIQKGQNLSIYLPISFVRRIKKKFQLFRNQHKSFLYFREKKFPVRLALFVNFKRKFF